MKKLAFGALCIGLLTMAACGGGDNDADARVIIRTDGGADASGDACNILLNSGCAAGQKCTWIRVSVSPPLGQVGCVMDGTVATNGACAYGAASATTGFDNCVGGNICLANPEADQAMGTCREICSLMDATAPCETGFACGSYYRFFSNSDNDTPLAGVCDPTCDPLSGDRDFDGMPNCGGPADPADPAARGCYGLPSNDASPTTFTCSGAGEGGHRTVLTPPYFLNSCASGNVPLLYERSGSMTVVCIATCQPRDCNNTLPAGCHRGVDPYQTTDRGCTAAGEECKYLWWFEAQETPVTAVSDGVGFCVDYTRYQWDNDEDPGTPDVNWMACRNSRDINDLMSPDAALADWFWGCIATTQIPPAVAPQTIPRASSHGITIRPIGADEIKRAYGN